MPTSSLVGGRLQGKAQGQRGAENASQGDSTYQTHAVVIVAGRVEGPVRHRLRGAGGTEKCERLKKEFEVSARVSCDRRPARRSVYAP